jgi:hypothetical protein
MGCGRKLGVLGRERWEIELATWSFVAWYESVEEHGMTMVQGGG